jgi:hypothetical protein
MNKKSIIPVSALISFGTITLADIQGNGRLPGTREILGFIIVYTMISAGADLGAVPIASGFAVLVMITILLTRGPEALEFILGKVSQPKRKKGKKRGGSATVTPAQTQKV